MWGISQRDLQASLLLCLLDDDQNRFASSAERNETPGYIDKIRVFEIN